MPRPARLILAALLALPLVSTGCITAETEINGETTKLTVTRFNPFRDSKIEGLSVPTKQGPITVNSDANTINVQAVQAWGSVVGTIAGQLVRAFVLGVP